MTVDAAQLLSRKQLVDWQYDLDERNLRATGSPRHEAYIDVLHERLPRAGVKQLRFEPMSLRQWSVARENWGLEVLDGERPGVLPSAGYIPYSGVTPPSGIAGRIVYLAPDSKPDASLAGKLVLVEMPKVAWTGQVFHQRAVHVDDPQHAMGPDTPYARPFQMLGPFIVLLDSLQAAGAAGVIVILDTPSLSVDGLYAPCDGVVRQLPGMFIERGRGQRPGKSEELMVLDSHTDGTNGLETNSVTRMWHPRSCCRLPMPAAMAVRRVPPGPMQAGRCGLRKAYPR